MKLVAVAAEHVGGLAAEFEVRGGMQNACTLSLLFFSSSDRFCEKILSHENPTN